MPNGISCAYFAVKNYSYGKQNNDLFRDGIAGAQTVRTVDTIAQTSKAAASVTSVTGKLAGLAKKIVYPLIILSGVRTTVKSNDKVKTGVEQASAISTMYAFEEISSKILNKAEAFLKKSSFMPKNKIANAALYLAKGSAFIAASMTGYNVGKDIGSKIISAARGEQKMNLQNFNSKTQQQIDSVYDEFEEFLSQDQDTKAE